MIGSVFLNLLLSAAVATAATEPPKPAPETALAPALPDEDIVLELRRARLAGQIGDREQQRATLDALTVAHPTDPTALAAALAFHREADGDVELTRSLRAKLLQALAQPGIAVPFPLLREVTRDPNTPHDELAQVLSVLVAQPGSGAERVTRLQLRVELLDRLHRRDEAIAALEELAGLDRDPYVAVRLLRAYREAGRWEDVLRVVGRFEEAKSGFEFGWWRLEAFAAMGRYDELSTEALALVGRSRTTTEITALLAPYAPEPFFPYVFILLDNGRRESAERLVAAIDAANPGQENVKRLRVMLFGSPEDRVAFLASAAGSTIASEDPDRIRAEAQQRLLARDYATAHQLYKRLIELGPTVAPLDGSDWFNDGLASIETSAWTDAETAMTHALDGGASRPRALAHRARARIMLGRTSEGIADAEAALAIDPKLKHACYAMYLAYQTRGDTVNANKWLERSKAP